MTDGLKVVSTYQFSPESQKVLREAANAAAASHAPVKSSARISSSSSVASTSSSGARSRRSTRGSLAGAPGAPFLPGRGRAETADQHGPGREGPVQVGPQGHQQRRQHQQPVAASTKGCQTDHHAQDRQPSRGSHDRATFKPCAIERGRAPPWTPSRLAMSR